jgi:hypothetical protein
MVVCPTPPVEVGPQAKNLAADVVSVANSLMYKSSDQLATYFSADDPNYPIYEADVQSAARANGLPVAFLACLIHAESRYNPHAYSGKSAEGIMQFDPSTRDTMREEGIRVNWNNGHEEIAVGAQLVQQEASQLFGAGKTPLSLNEMKVLVASYNMGPGALQSRCGPPPIDADACMAILVPADEQYLNPFDPYRKEHWGRTKVQIQMNCWQSWPPRSELWTVAPCASLDEADEVVRCMSPDQQFPLER